MKGKVSTYVVMPNVGRVRSRINNPSKDLTAKFREILSEVVANTINANVFSIRAQFITAVAELGLDYKSKAYKAAVESILEPFFDVFAATSAAGINALDDSEESTDLPEEDSADAAPEESSEEKSEESDDFE